MNNANKRYLRAKEVAEYLSIGLSTVWLYASQGRLAAKKLSPRVTVFDIEEVNRLLGDPNECNENLSDL
ncbi:MAG: helix-turn-helix domain-containing protein [Sulfurovum sp.]|nr:helix-turn-helix domain-containing protein [Sulfurovum sp.]MDD3602639.1 helix-turn-helix domain-containing protein [Sulfurovum sp.]